MASRPVLRIFISSTAVDLLDYRGKVRDAVLRLEGLPIAMETFSAKSGQPVEECMRMAAEAEAVICIVAHRYGYVPPLELGGDGERGQSPKVGTRQAPTRRAWTAASDDRRAGAGTLATHATSSSRRGSGFSTKRTKSIYGHE